MVAGSHPCGILFDNDFLGGGSCRRKLLIAAFIAQQRVYRFTLVQGCRWREYLFNSVRHALDLGEIAFLLNVGIFDLFFILGAVDDCVLILFADIEKDFKWGV